MTTILMFHQIADVTEVQDSRRMATSPREFSKQLKFFMPRSELREKAVAGLEFSRHTVSYANLTTLSSDEILVETGDSKKKIEDNLAAL